MIDVPSEDLRVMLEAGYLYLGMQRYQEAREVFEGIIVLAPKSEVPLVALGNIWCVQGMFKEAIKTYQKALELQPNSPFVKSFLGEALLFSGQKDEAMQNLQEASGLDPKGKSGDFARSLLDLIKKGFEPNPEQMEKLRSEWKKGQ